MVYSEEIKKQLSIIDKYYQTLDANRSYDELDKLEFLHGNLNRAINWLKMEEVK